MPETLVALAREKRALLAVVSTAEDDKTGPRCAVVQKRIDEIRPEACPAAARSVEAWRRLEGASLRDPYAVAAAVAVLIETVPFRNDKSGGTTEALTDLVSHTAAWHRLRPAVEAAWDEVDSVLRGLGFDPRGLSRLREARDPYVAYHHGACDAPGLAALPAGFRTAILPLLRPRPWREVRRGLALYWSLGLGHEETLRAVIVRLLAVSPIHGAGWWATLPALPPERRALFARLLLETGAHAASPEPVPVPAFEALARVPADRFTDRARHLVVGVRDGIPARHMLEGFRVADRFARGHRFVARWNPRDHRVERPDPCADAEAAVTPVLEHVGRAHGGRVGRLPVDLWERCARRPEVAAVLRRPCLFEWPPATALEVLRLFAYDDDGPALPPGARMDAAERLLRGVPEARRTEALDALEFCMHRWARRADAGLLVETAVVFLIRLAHAGKEEGSSWGPAARYLVEAAGRSRRARLLALPASSLGRLERALGRNDAALLHNGLAALAGRAGSFLIEALGAHPEPLFGAARTLGSMSVPRQVQVVKRFRAHPVMRGGFADRALPDVCRDIGRLAAPGIPSPVPRRLREHLEGGAPLSAASIERHRQAIVRRLLPFRLALLRRLAVEDLATGLPAIDPVVAKERHALQMLGAVKANRRFLRHVLRVDPSERSRFLREHPANVRWLRAHPRLDPVRWAEGIAHTVEITGYGRLRLAVEADPLEVLRMGTQVGSCLSVGGAWDESAVAVMADVNKQVVFARTADGTFAARQLVAIADDDRLVFFPVYPLGAPVALKDAFHAYDLDLAAAVGLEPARQGAVYQVGEIVARSFYDDGVWDRFPDPERGEN